MMSDNSILPKPIRRPHIPSYARLRLISRWTEGDEVVKIMEVREKVIDRQKVVDWIRDFRKRWKAHMEREIGK